jgi:tetratricopeptide (TPR) repeat protein
VLGFVQTGSQLVALRYSYLAALPLALLAGASLLLLARRFGAPALACGALLLVPLGLATANECRVWHDTFSLWQRDLALDPADAPARRNLIVAWLDQGRAARDPALRRSSLEQALEQCREGLRHGQDAAYFMNAAKVYDLFAEDEPAQRQHWLELALAEARKSVAFVEHSRQRLYEAYESCGAILCKLERPAEAVPYFQKLCELDPRSVQRLGMLAEALLQSGRAQEAIAALERARTLDPDSSTLWLALGDAQRAAGDRAAALKAYRAALDRRRAQLGPRTSGDAEYEAAAQAIRELSSGR